MKKLARILPLVSVLAAGAASAGTKTGFPVTINLKAHSAVGTLGSARNAPDSLSLMGCDYYADASVDLLYCWARDAAGTYVGCQNFYPSDRLRAIALGVKGDGSLMFRWDDTGKCLSLETATTSDFEPKQP